MVMAWLPTASRLDDQSVKDMNVFVHDLVLSIAKPIQPHIHMLSISQNICIQIIVSQKLRFSS